MLWLTATVLNASAWWTARRVLGRPVRREVSVQSEELPTKWIRVVAASAAVALLYVEIVLLGLVGAIWSIMGGALVASKAPEWVPALTASLYFHLGWFGEGVFSVARGAELSPLKQIDSLYARLVDAPAMRTAIDAARAQLYLSSVMTRAGSLGMVSGEVGRWLEDTAEGAGRTIRTAANAIGRSLADRYRHPNAHVDAGMASQSGRLKELAGRLRETGGKVEAYLIDKPGAKEFEALRDELFGIDSLCDEIIALSSD